MTITRFSRNLALGGDDIGLPEAKAHLRVTGDSEDGLIELYISASLAAVENYTGFWFGIWDVEVDFAKVETLPRSVLVPFTNPPVDPVLEYIDEASAPQTAPIETVAYDALNRTACFTLPEVDIEPETEFRITYTTRRPEAGSVSEALHMARLIVIGALFINRDDGEVIPPGARMLLDSFRQNQA